MRLATLLGLGLGLLVACDGDRRSPTEPPPWVVDCTAGYPDQASSPYVLPFPEGSVIVAGQTLGHGGPQRFAIDVAQPVGALFVAMRAGEVVSVEDRYFDGDHLFGHENHVYVEHDDGTVARYIHLTHAGAMVAVGDVVRQGDVLGLTGDTGNVGPTPHLHFDVTRCCCAMAPDYNELPCGQTLPLTFSNTRSHPCGLVSGETYAVGPLP